MINHDVSKLIMANHHPIGRCTPFVSMQIHVILRFYNKDNRHLSIYKNRRAGLLQNLQCALNRKQVLLRLEVGGTVVNIVCNFR